MDIEGGDDQTHKPESMNDELAFTQVVSKEPIDNELQSLVRTTSLAGHKLTKSLSIRYNSMIERLFFGSMTSQYLVGDEVIEGEDSMFGPILLDPTANYFYKSWENYFYNIVEEFRDTKQRAAKWDLVRKFPEILCFQIQRAGYSKEKKCAEKNNQRFEFDQEIYVDRFLQENREVVQGLRKKAEALENERIEIEKELKAISQFRENRDIIKSLDDVLQLVEALNNKDDSAHHLPPKFFDFDLKNKSEIISSLTSLRNELDDEKQMLSKRKQAIETETSTLYTSIEKTKYVLFSIIIHEGSAESGHFYCLVRMQDKWFKFNDFYVREMTETEVFELAFGYQGSVANAYCVFYMKDSIFSASPSHNFANIGESQEGFFDIVPKQKLFNVEQANKSFNNQIHSNQIKKINAEYITRHDYVTRNFDDRYKDWKGKVTGMRSICDFFKRNSLFTSTCRSKFGRSWRP